MYRFLQTKEKSYTFNTSLHVSGKKDLEYTRPVHHESSHAGLMALLLGVLKGRWDVTVTSSEVIKLINLKETSTIGQEVKLPSCGVTTSAIVGNNQLYLQFTDGSICIIDASKIEVIYANALVRNSQSLGKVTAGTLKLDVNKDHTAKLYSTVVHPSVLRGLFCINGATDEKQDVGINQISHDQFLVHNKNAFSYLLWERGHRCTCKHIEIKPQHEYPALVTLDNSDGIVMISVADINKKVSSHTSHEALCESMKD